MTLPVNSFGQEYDSEESTPQYSVKEKEPSPWESNNDYWAVEYQLRYLMDANIEAHILKNKGVNVNRLLNHLSEGLTSLYSSAIDCMKKSPNPRLVEILLEHNKAYLKGSSSEVLAENIESLRSRRTPAMSVVPIL